MAPVVSSPAALRLPGLGYRTLREDAVGRISVAPSGTKTGTVSAVSCPAALHLPGRRYRGLRDPPVGRIRRSRHPAQRQVWRRRCPARRRCACRACGICACGVPEIMLLICNPINPGKAFVALISAHIALPVNRLRYAWHGAGSAQGAASRRRPLYPRARASKIAAARSLRLIPAGCGSGRGSVPAKHGPQPASMRAAPAFRERLSDFEAVSTGSFSRSSGSINGRSHAPQDGQGVSRRPA